MISYIYDQIQSLGLASLNSIKSLWEEDFGEEPSEEPWEGVSVWVHTSSECANHI